MVGVLLATLHSLALVCPTSYRVEGVQLSTERCNIYLAILAGGIKAVLCDVGGQGMSG